jgi:hypothetical protein
MEMVESSSGMDPEPAMTGIGARREATIPVSARKRSRRCWMARTISENENISVIPLPATGSGPDEPCSMRRYWIAVRRSRIVVEGVSSVNCAAVSYQAVPVVVVKLFTARW